MEKEFDDIILEFRMKNQDNFICKCGEIQGKVCGDWKTYPKPLICHKCMRNNTKKYKKWAISHKVIMHMD